MARPVCQRCQRYPRECEFHPAIIHYRSPQASPRRVQDVLRNSTTLRHIPWKASLHLYTAESHFLFNHFQTHTLALILPFAPHFLTSSLLSAALDTPGLLHAVLAISCSHHARLVSNTSQKSKTVLKFTTAAVSQLHNAIDNIKAAPKFETVMTAIMLCANEVCNGNSAMWRLHNSGVRSLLGALFDGNEQGEISDPLILCLVKIFICLDIGAGLSSSEDLIPEDTNFFLSRISAQNKGYIDGLCGYSLDLIPLISQVNRLARDENLKTCPNSKLKVPCEEFSGESRALESQILSLLELIPMENKLSANSEKVTAELLGIHHSFVFCALLHLHRRVCLLPRNHAVVRCDIENIIRALTTAEPSSAAAGKVLWPLFSIGCLTDDWRDRCFVEERMRAMQSIGMENFGRALLVLHKLWDSQTSMPWELYLSQHKPGLIFF